MLVYRLDFVAGLFDVFPLATCAPLLWLFASRLFVLDVLWKSFRNADITRSFGRNDIFWFNTFNKLANFKISSRFS